MKQARTSPHITIWAMLGAALIFLTICPISSPGQAADLRIRPFYFERAAYVRDVSGAMVMFSRDIAARRSDGAFVSINYFRNRPGLRRVVMPDTSLTWLVDQIRTKTSWPKGSVEGSTFAKSATRSTTDCDIADQSTPHELISGIDTIVVTAELDSVQRERFWYAPELGCQALQIRRFTDQGTVLGENLLLSLDLAEPAASLFDIGKSYESVGPSELRARQYQAGGEQVKASDFQRLAPDLEREFQALRDRH
jgi:hypothetical protein